MFNEASAIAERESVRALIATKVAAYEAENGPVETLPIRTDDKRMPYRISCPEKKLSVEAAKAKGRSKINEQRKEVRAANKERILALSGCKLTAKAIAERTGISVTVVREVLRELKEHDQ